MPLAPTPDAPFRATAPAAGVRRELVLPEPELFTLANGMSVVLVRRQHPTVVAAIVSGRAGDNDLSVAPGVAQLTARLLGLASRRHAGFGLADALSEAGIDFDAETYRDGTVAVAQSTAASAERAIELLAEAVREPAFAPAQFDRMREIQMEARADAVLDASRVGGLLVMSLLYPMHVNSRPLSGARPEIASRRADQILAFHHDRYTPDTSMLVVSGAIERPVLERVVERTFGDWPRAAPLAARQSGVVTTARTPRLNIINEPNRSQSQIVIAYDVVPAGHRDIPGLEAMSTILGDLFSSRLNLAIREQMGHSYGVHIGLDVHLDVGTLWVETHVAAERTGEVLGRMLAEIALMRRQPVTQDEMAGARAHLRESQLESLETNHGTAILYAAAALQGQPLSFVRDTLASYDSVTAADVQRVARTYLDPARREIVLVGDAFALTMQCGGQGLGPTVRYNFQQ